jgi:hypothetical protein
MKTTYYFSALILLLSITINAQEVDENQAKKPASIYTFSAFSNDENSFSAIQKKLKLYNFSFVFMNAIALDLNQFSIDFKDVGKTPSAFIYDDYKRYQDRNLLKGFLLKNDPTRWNLQRPQPNLE